MIKVKDGYAKLINTSYTGDISQVLLSNGGTIGYDVSTNTILATIGSNVASADKLKNEVKLWGQYFDGTRDVRGSIHLGEGADYEIGTGYSSRNPMRYNKIVFGCSTTGIEYHGGNWTGGSAIAHTFIVGSPATKAMIINNSGNITIGSSDLAETNYKLYVDGNIRTTGIATANKFVSGDGINDFSAGTVKLDVLNIPTSSGGTTFGPGSNGQVLKSNGTTVYWASDSSSNSWRAIQVNGTQIAGTGTDTYALNFISGTGITVAGTSGSSSAANSITITNAGVRSTTINGNYLRVNTNGTNADLTIPYATTASQLSNTSVSDPSKAASGQYLKWYSQVNQASGYAGTNYGFPVSNNANGILWLGTHSGPYGWQMGFSSNGRIYARYISNNSFSTTANGGSWNKIAWVSDIPAVTNYYWANVKVSSTSSTTTSPTFANTTINGTLTMGGVIVTQSGSSTQGIKFGTSYLNQISNQLLWQSPEAIRFGSSSWDWSSWAGLKYVHSSKTVHLGLADGTIFTANAAQGGGTLNLPGISHITSSYYKMAVGHITSHTHTTTGGWYRVAKLKSYFNYDIHISGSWSTGMPSVIKVNVCQINGTAKITQLAGYVGSIGSQIRLGKVATDEWDVLFYSPGFSSGTMAQQNFVFFGIGNITTYTTNTISTTSYTSTLDLVFKTLSGVVLTTDNYSSYLGYIGTTAVQKSSATQALTGISRISNSTSSPLYLGNSGNQSWVMTQDICSHSGSGNWAINIAGIAWFKYLNVGYTYNTTSGYAFGVTGSGYISSTLTMGNSILAAGNLYYTDSKYGIQMNNSDIIGANGIYFGDSVDGAGEGLHFYRSSTTWDTLTAANGVLYFSPNRATATHTLTPVFSALSNSGNNISITIGGQNRTLTPAYATKAGDADTLDGYHRSNLFTSYVTWMEVSGLNKSITVGGNADTYYPVVISVSSSKLDSTRISVWKNLGSTTPSYYGNHSNGTSSLWLIYEGRNWMWDGNGGFIKTWYKYQGYATLVAHAEQAGSGVGNLVLYLRGGGCQYNIACSNSFTATVYTASTNIGSSSYPVNVAPRTTMGNGGIIQSKLGYGSVDSASTATLASTVTVNNSDANSTYRMVWHSGNTLFSTAGIYCNPSTDCLYASHYYETSDIAFKTNIKPILNSDNIPVLKSFDWKSDGSHSYGLIAQELEAMGYPELVSEGDGYKTVNYSAALSLIVGKLQVKIKELEKEIEILKSKN